MASDHESDRERLERTDPEVFDCLRGEEARQVRGIELIFYRL